MEILLDQLVNGLTRGAEYALIAAGLALIFGVVQIVNFAHGEFYLVGAYLLVFFQSTVFQSIFGDWVYPASAFLTIASMAVFGAAFYFVVVRRMLDHGYQTQIVATIAASIFLINLVVAAVGSAPRTVTSPLIPIILSVAGVRFSAQRVLVLACALATFVLLYLFLKRTKLGKAMRAISQNRDAALIVGIDVSQVALAAVVIGAILAGVSAATVPPLTLVIPAMGTVVIIKVFAAVIMGGFGNVAGAIASAFLIGIVEALAIGFVSSAYSDAIVFGVMILVLVVRPHGVFGKAVRE